MVKTCSCASHCGGGGDSLGSTCSSRHWCGAVCQAAALPGAGAGDTGTQNHRLRSACGWASAALQGPRPRTGTPAAPLARSTAARMSGPRTHAARAAVTRPARGCLRPARLGKEGPVRAPCAPAPRGGPPYPAARSLAHVWGCQTSCPVVGPHWGGRSGLRTGSGSSHRLRLRPIARPSRAPAPRRSQGRVPILSMRRAWTGELVQWRCRRPSSAAPRGPRALRAA